MQQLGGLFRRVLYPLSTVLCPLSSAVNHRPILTATKRAARRRQRASFVSRFGFFFLMLRCCCFLFSLLISLRALVSPASSRHKVHRRILSFFIPFCTHPVPRLLNQNQNGRHTRSRTCWYCKFTKSKVCFFFL